MPSQTGSQLRSPTIRLSSLAALPTMTTSKSRQYTIKGITHSGRVFRPSDWSERLAGAMSCFRPGGQSAGGGGGADRGIGAYIGYSPYCVPQLIDGVKCVLVDDALREIEPMAWDFLMNFARDNELPVSQNPLA